MYHDGEDKWQKLNFGDCQDWHFCETPAAGTCADELIDTWTMAATASQRTRARTMSRDLGAAAAAPTSASAATVGAATKSKGD